VRAARSKEDHDITFAEENERLRKLSSTIMVINYLIQSSLSQPLHLLVNTVEDSRTALALLLPIMVRNWQNRVEQTKERRKQSKKRKDDIGEKRKNKQQVHDFITVLDKCKCNRGDIKTLHVWTDAIPKDGPRLSDMLVGGGGEGGGSYHDNDNNSNSHTNSKRKGSIDKNDKSSTPPNEAPRKGGSKKKSHPRSKGKEAVEAAVEAETEMEAPLLCRAHFFTGKCEDSGKNSNKCGCRYKHYLAKIQSLSKALNLNSKKSVNNNKEEKVRQLQLSDTALLATLPDELAFTDPDGMEMLYYLPVNLPNKNNSNDGVEDDKDKINDNDKISDEIAQVFSSGGIPLSSMTYVVINETLVYDRFRDGLLLSEEELALAVVVNHVADVGGGSADAKPQQVQQQQQHNSTRRTTSIGSEGDDDDDPVSTLSEDVLVSLPGCILEHILTYSPDQTVTAASRVCKSWYFEIGQNSPNLWKHLLERHAWPFPSYNNTADEITTSAATNTEQAAGKEEEDGKALELTSVSPQQLIYREAFLQHYSAVRDATAIKSAVTALTSNKRGSTMHKQQEQKEMTFQDFSTRKHAPSEPNYCLAMRVWSPTRVLAAYSRDCSLRLFESVSKGSPGGTDGTLACRELVCQKIDPYKNTKRRSCDIVSMDLDDQSIGCLCEVVSNNAGDVAVAYILVVMSRDDFLLGDSSEAGGSDDPTLKVIDIGEAVLSYLVSADVVDHRLLELTDFFADGHAVGEVEVLVSHTVLACGFGRFMLEISISIPSDDPFEPMLLLDRKLVLLSSSASAIVWVGESNDPSRPLRPRHEDMTLAKMKLPLPGRSKAECTVAVSSSTSPDIRVTVVEPSGHIYTLPVEASDLVRNEIVVEGWDVAVMRSRPLIVTELDVVATDVLHQRVEDRVLARKTFVSFYPRFPAVDESSYQILQLDGNVEAIRLVRVRDTHAIVVCRKYEKLTIEQQVDEQETPDVSNVSLYAIILDIPSRQEIGRISLLEDVGAEELSHDYWLEFSIDNGATIGAGLSWKGVLMTGKDVRSVGDSAAILVPVADDPRSNKKKTKKKPTRKANKKELFARGKNT
jgi:hypothetical protein